jgi:hypothetical protein
MDDPAEVAVKVFGFVVYLCLCGVVLWLVTLPLLTVTMFVGAAAGALSGVAIVGGTLGGLGPRPHLVVPADVVAGHWLRPTRSAVARDSAWPIYLAAQWRSDLTQAWRNAVDTSSAAWAGARATTLTRKLYWGWPLLLLPAALLGAATVAGLASVAVALAVCVLLLAVAAGSALVIAVALRAWDRGVRLHMRARASCPHPGCNEVSDLPGFACACGVVHRDLRPGALGIVRRRCSCGRLLPTTVLRATRALPVLCPRCERLLHPRAGGITDIRIPVIGPVSAGKTRFVHAAMTALERACAAAGATFAAADPASKRVFTDGSARIMSHDNTTKTPSDRSPAAISAVMRTGAQEAILHLFDPAGELLAVRSRGDRLPFLDEAQGFVLVIDPFSIPAVAERMSDRLPAAHAVDDPEQSYDVTAQRLRDRGVRLAKRSLAVTIVKADLLQERPSDVRQWLCDQDVDGLVLTAERDFGHVRYFLVSSWTGWDPVDPLTTLPPLAWLMAQGSFSVAAP